MARVEKPSSEPSITETVEGAHILMISLMAVGEEATEWKIVTSLIALQGKGTSGKP